MYDPEMFADPMMPNYDEMMTQDSTSENDFFTPPLPKAGDPINIRDLNSMPEPAFEISAPSRCEDPDKCYWQGEDPFLFAETDISSGNPVPKAMRWHSSVSSEADRIDSAAARIMETHAWPWESPMHEFVESLETVAHAADDPATRSKRAQRMRNVNSDAADPTAAATLTMRTAEPPKQRAQLEGLFTTMALPGLNVVPHPIPPEDGRAPQEACKHFAGVDSGLEIGVVSSGAVFSSGATVDFFSKCVQHRMQHSVFEKMHDVRNGIANTKATVTVTRRVRRRLAEEHGGEDNFPPHVRRLFAHPDEHVNPLTFTRLHSVHRKRTARVHASRLRVQQNRRQRMLRRRLETGDESIVIPTVNHDLVPSLLDRLLLGSAEKDEKLLSRAHKKKLLVQFETEVREELRLLDGANVLTALPLNDFEYLVGIMHDYYASFEASQTNTGDKAECFDYNPTFSSTNLDANGNVDLPTTGALSEKDQFTRCMEPFHSGVPEETAFFAEKVKKGEITTSQFFDDGFAGKTLPPVSTADAARAEEKKILDNLAGFHTNAFSCFCECKKNWMYNAALTADCSGSLTIDSVTKTKCQFIADAKLVDKLDDCALPLTLRRRLESNEPECIILNGEEYCKPGKAIGRKLSTRRHPSRKLQTMRRHLRQHLKKAFRRGKLQKHHRRNISRAIARKIRNRRRSRRRGIL
eukprot:GEMP01008120.1.p1 GENE.GEMP01008120.1~~GEMP01008120.1.p1  ORF type:complete len:693 (+),score=127.64 GEMP01008120.1:668-2746(+)